MARAPLFAFTAPENMTEAVFAAMLLVIAQAPHWHNDDTDRGTVLAECYAVGAIEGAAYTISCLIAQRYDDGIGTGDVVDVLDLSNAHLSNESRASLIEGTLRSFRNLHSGDPA